MSVRCIKFLKVVDATSACACQGAVGRIVVILMIRPWAGPAPEEHGIAICVVHVQAMWHICEHQAVLYQVLLWQARPGPRFTMVS